MCRTEAMESLSKWERQYGWLVRWGIVLLVAYIALVHENMWSKGDVRYVTQDKHDQAMAVINSRIDQVAQDGRQIDSAVRVIQTDIARIAAQNELILKRLEAR